MNHLYSPADIQETATEKRLAVIWEELLDTEHVSVEDNFFECGGDSFLALRCIAAIRVQFNKEVSVKDLFMYAELSTLAKYIDQKQEQAASILPTANKPGYVPLSFTQERVWFIDKFEGSKAYHIPIAFRIAGAINFHALEQALRGIVNKHEVLRTVIRDQDGKPEGHRLPADDWRLKFIETVHDEKYLQSLLGRLIEEPFDLSQDPMLKAWVINIQENENILLLLLHHIATDRWSLSILLEELVKGYNSLVDGGSYSPASPGYQYADYAAWQRNQMTGEGLTRGLQYWTNKLKDVNTLEIPTDSPRSGEHGRGEVLRFTIDSELSNQVRTLSQQQQSTLFMTLLAAFKILLYRYSGQEDICVGTPVAGRPLHESERLIGFFVNTLALRNKVGGNDNFISLLQQVKETTLEAYGHQIVPFERIVEAVQEEDRNRNPLFRHMFALHNTPAIPSVRLSNLEVKQEHVRQDTAMFDLRFSMMQSGDELHGTIEYSTGLYKEETILRMAQHYTQLLHSIVKSPGTEVRHLQMLSKPEIEELTSLTQTKTVYTNEKSVVELFEEQVKQQPQAVSLIDDNGSISYIELDDRIKKLSHYLFTNGVRKGSIVAVCMDKSCNMIAAMMAVLKTGASYVPIEPSYPVARIQYIINDTTPALIFTDRASGKILESIGLDNGVDVEDCISKPASVDSKAGRSGEDIFCIIYTSGSTGQPKGVKIRQKSILNRFHWMWNTYPFSENEVCAGKTSIGFVDHIWELFGALTHGVPVVLFSRENVLDLDVFIAKLAQYKITRLVLVPSLLKVILARPVKDLQQLESIKCWISSGEVLPANLVEDFYIHFPPARYTLLNIYGSTEVTADVTCYDTAAVLRDETGDQSLFDITLGTDIDQLITAYSQRTDTIGTDKQWKLPDHFYDVSIDQPMKPAAYIQFLKDDLLPNVVNVSAPGLAGHMTGAIPGFIKDMSALVSELNQNLVKTETSFVASSVERQVLGILHKLVYNEPDSYYRQFLHDSEHCLGIITNGGTISNLAAISYALHKIFAPKENFQGIGETGLMESMNFYRYKKAVIIGSDLLHYSFDKTLRITGLGKSSRVVFNFDKQFPEKSRRELSELINNLRSQQVLVLAIVGVAGATETGRVDPLDELAAIASQFNIHFHVDAAFGGPYLFSSRLAKKLAGIEKADSVTICGHKQLFLPIGASICLFKSPDLATYSENNSYYQARKGSYDLGRYTIEGSRPFVSLLLHSVLKLGGASRLGEVIEQNHDKTQAFAEMIRNHDAFELLEEPELNILVYRYVPVSLRNKIQESILSTEESNFINDLNRHIQKIQFFRKKHFVSFTEIKHPFLTGTPGRIVVLRAVIMNPHITIGHLNDILHEQVLIAEEILMNRTGTVYEQYFPELNPGVSDTKKPGVLIGRPIANTSIYIVDKDGNLVPKGFPGELCVGGMPVSDGYLNQPGLTRDKFKLHSFNSEINEMVYHTGDLVRWLPDGNIEYIGRLDEQAKIRGNRVEPREIEEVLEQAQFIKQAVVLAPKKNDDTRLIAYIVVQPGYKESAITDWMKARLPDYMIPLLMVIDEIPLNANGKIDKKALPDPYEMGYETLSTVSPRNEIEEKLVMIWKQLLQEETISVLDDFFRLGGHSLLITQMVSAIRKEFEVELPVRHLFELTTIEAIARYIQFAQERAATETAEYEEIKL